MHRRQFIGMAGAFLAVGLLSQVCAAAPENYNPATTTVAILPVIDKTGVKMEKQRIAQIENGKKTLAEQFSRHGFKLVDDSAVARAVADLKINLDDEEEHRRETVYKIGRAVNADLVVFLVVTETRQQLKRSFFSEEKEGLAKIKIWFLDVKRESPILSAVVKEGKAAGKTFLGPAFESGSDRMANAVSNATKQVLEDFFKPYPVVQK